MAVTVTFTDDGIAILRMKRGENRINKEFLDAFHACLDEVERNTRCRGLITTGEGKFFSNGLDLEWMSQLSGDDVQRHMDGLTNLMARLLVFPLPTLAAINGHGFAGGMMLAMAHDLRVMNSQRGWLSLNEVFLGMRLPTFPLEYIQHKTHPQTMHRLAVLGQKFTGLEAESAGLIDKAITPSLLMSDSQRLLRKWLGKEGFPRESLHNMKKDIYEGPLKVVAAAKL